MRYLLDTDIVSDLVRNPQGRVTSRIRPDRGASSRELAACALADFHAAGRRPIG